MSDYLEADEFWPRIKAGTMDKFDLVLHLGACSSTTEQDVAYLIHNNYELTKRLAYWSLSVGARFVYASSAATYGDGGEGMRDTEHDVTRFRPQNAYGFSKHLFDCHAMKPWASVENRRIEILQRLWPERRPQGRHAQYGL